MASFTGLTFPVTFNGFARGMIELVEVASCGPNIGEGGRPMFTINAKFRYLSSGPRRPLYRRRPLRKYVRSLNAPARPSAIAAQRIDGD